MEQDLLVLLGRIDGNVQLLIANAQDDRVTVSKLTDRVKVLEDHHAARRGVTAVLVFVATAITGLATALISGMFKTP
jgi:hypothetical protein